MVNILINELLQLINTEKKYDKESMLKEIEDMDDTEREELGRRINHLKAKSIKNEPYMYRLKKSEPIKTNIKFDDKVLISPQHNLKFRKEGTIIEIKRNSITIDFDEIPTDWIDEELRVDLYVNNTSYKRMEKNLEEITDNGIRALQLKLNNIKPQKIEKKVKLKYYDNELNNNQTKAVENSINSSDFYLIHGPFGTGKTKTLIEIIRQESKLNHKIIVTAESNTAVDNIAERLFGTLLHITRIGNSEKISEKINRTRINYQIEHHELYGIVRKIDENITVLKENLKEYTKPSPKLLKEVKEDEIISYGDKKLGILEYSPSETISRANWLKTNQKLDFLYNERKNTMKKIENEIINSSQVILCTNSSAALEIIKDIEFDVAIIDEAGQATIPSILIPINKSKKFILAGDHKQLPPTIKSNKAKQLENTLFEDLITNFPNQNIMLNIQHRMNNELMEFPNKMFYNNKLKTDKKAKENYLNIKLPNYDINYPLVFIDTCNRNNEEHYLKKSKSPVNYLEVKIVLSLVKQYLNKNISKNDIGIITPYSNQVKLIKKKVPVEVNTVDGFQGKEKEIIIISNVRSNLKNNVGFLDNPKRLNVALTRAKKKMIIIGNSKTLQYNQIYKNLINHCKEKNCLIKYN